MAVVDWDALDELQCRLQEPEDNGFTFPSVMWTHDEVAGYLNQRQQRFLSDTLLLGSETTIACTAHQQRHALPNDTIAIIVAAWIDATSGRPYPLGRGDHWEADHGEPLWELTPGLPLLFNDAEVRQGEIMVLPPPVLPGEVHLVYVGLPAVLGSLLASEIFTVPDEYVPAVMYGVMADMLGKVGEAHDPGRAAYCESRYAEGVEAAKLLLTGGV